MTELGTSSFIDVFNVNSQSIFSTVCLGL